MAFTTAAAAASTFIQDRLDLIPGEAWGAFGVLATNVAMMIVAASGTLLLQRRLARRTAPQSGPVTAKRKPTQG